MPDETPAKPEEAASNVTDETIAPLPANPVANAPSNNGGDIAALTTLLAALPEKVAHAVRESIPAPVAETPKTESNPPKNDAPVNTPEIVDDTKPGKRSAKVTFFGIPWE